ncbi:MAG: carboxypeptidase regulatory-like domain-containing protein, partial [Acidobacteriota bacterium]
LEVIKQPEDSTPAPRAGGGSPAARTLRIALPAATIVTGRVVEAGPRARPLAGALVWVLRDARLGVVTDARGDFTLMLPPAESGPGHQVLRAAAPAHAAVQMRLLADAADADDARALTFRLPAADLLRGRVVDVRGRPLTDVAITARRDARVDHGPLRGLLGSHASARSGADGGFVLRGVPRDVPLRLHMRKDGYVADDRTIGRDRAPREIALRRALDAVGEVVDLDGRPVANAVATLQPAPEDQTDPEARWRRGRGLRPAWTDRDGRFVARALEPGRYHLTVEADGLAPVTVPGVRVAMPEAPAPARPAPDDADAAGAVAGDPAPIADLGQIVLVPGVPLAGRVVDGDGLPIAAAAVRIGRTDGRGAATLLGVATRQDRRADAVTDVDGGFVVDALEPGSTVLVDVSHAAHATARQSVRVPAAGDARGPVTFTLAPLARLGGQVVDADGQPVIGARVAVSGRGRGIPQNTTQVTGADGRFTIDRVVAGPNEIIVDADGFRRFRMRDVTPPANGAIDDLVLTLTRGLRVVGRVETEAGDPVPGTFVHLEPNGRARVGLEGDGATTDDRGRFAIDGLGAGSYTATAYSERYGQARTAVLLRTDAEGPAEIALTLPIGQPVRGRVEDAAGQPVVHASVMLRSGAEPARNQGVRTGADGRFEIASVRAGRYRLRVQHPAYAAHTLPERIRVDDAPVEGVRIVLSPGARVRGQLEDVAFEDLGRVFVHAQQLERARDSGGGDSRQGRVDHDATYVITGLSPGRWRISARVGHSGARAPGGVVEIVDGADEKTFDLRFERGVTLTGSVLRSDGAPAAGVVAATALGTDPAQRSGGGRTSIDGAGRFRLAHLPPGPYRVVVYGSDRAVLHSREIDLDGDRDVAIEIAGGGLTVDLRSTVDDRSIEGAQLGLRQLDDGDAATGRYAGGAVTDVRGRARFASVAVGRYALTVRRDGFRALRETVEIRDGDQQALALAMTPSASLQLDVVGPDGLPPASVWMAAIGDDGQRMTLGLLPVIDGRVTVDALDDGGWTLLLKSDDSAQMAVTVAIAPAAGAAAPGTPVGAGRPRGDGAPPRAPPPRHAP